MEISAETIDGILGETSVDSTAVQQPSPYYCWRNLFSSINLLRILNKLTKWKNCRIMMLVLFKSAQPLKPFIGNVFDWLLTGEVQLDIGVDFFIRKKEKEVGAGSFLLKFLFLFTTAGLSHWQKSTI